MRTERPQRAPRPAKDVALALLARREHSRSELSLKLRQRGYAKDDIDAALNELVERGYQDDSRAAEVRISSGLRRGHGPQLIRAKLSIAGLEDGQGIFDTDIDWLAAARELLRKKFGELPAEGAKDAARRSRFLQSRGYSGEIIRKALRSA